MAKRIKRLSHDDKRVLLLSMAVRSKNLFDRLKEQVYDLEVNEYFDKHYRNLRTLVYLMEKDYPEADLSTNDIDKLYRRLHMND